jgi:general secretion pathway protein M
MTPVLSPLFARIVAVALLATAALLVHALVVEPYLAVRHTAEAELAETRAALARMVGLTDRLAERREVLAALKRRRGAAEGLLQGGSETLIAAQLQNRIKILADAADAEVRSVQVLQARSEAGFRRIAVRGQVQGSLAGIQKLFYEIESARPYLFLDNVELRAVQATSRSRDESKRDGTLDVRFELYGFARVSA